jgi:hypothetical protein
MKHFILSNPKMQCLVSINFRSIPDDITGGIGFDERILKKGTRCFHS